MRSRPAAATLTDQLVKPQKLNHRDRDSQTEIDILGCLARDGCGQFDTALAEGEYQRVFPLDNEIGNRRMEAGDEHSQAKPGDFKWHNNIVAMPVTAAQYNLRPIVWRSGRLRCAPDGPLLRARIQLGSRNV